MAIGTRILVFMFTNILIVLSISVVLNLLGVPPYLTGKGLNFESLIALKSLQNTAQPESDTHESIAAFKISAVKTRGLLALIATHPPLEERIKRLQAA